MKKNALLIVALLLTYCTLSAQTNDFYDDAPQSGLTMSSLVVEGEVANPGPVDFNALPLRQVIVKETEFAQPDGKFTGAYQYEGYSLYDILDKIVLKKKNQDDFPPIIDLYVEIENTKGDKVVFSWGEIYYPINRHQILIASKVRRIVPSKTKELWPLPTISKLVAATDLFTSRNIDSPVKITIKSLDANYKIDRNTSEMYAPEVAVYNHATKVRSITDNNLQGIEQQYNTVFYGRGMGIHGTSPFKGVILKDYLTDFLPLNPDQIKRGIIVAAGMDGYRGVYTYSEVFNRNDQSELLLVPQKDTKGQGAYMLFPAMDFFSDRAIKVLSEIRLIELK